MRPPLRPCSSISARDAHAPISCGKRNATGSPSGTHTHTNERPEKTCEHNRRRAPGINLRLPLPPRPRHVPASRSTIQFHCRARVISFPRIRAVSRWRPALQRRQATGLFLSINARTLLHSHNINTYLVSSGCVCVCVRWIVLESFWRDTWPTVTTVFWRACECMARRWKCKTAHAANNSNNLVRPTGGGSERAGFLLYTRVCVCVLRMCTHGGLPCERCGQNNYL